MHQMIGMFGRSFHHLDLVTLNHALDRERADGPTTHI
jgi:hypothetical protein